MQEELDLSNKVSIITGGTSGIGLAIAKSFYLHNSHVIIIGRNLKRGEAAVSEILGSCREDTFQDPDLGGNGTGPGFCAHKKTNRIIFMPCDISNHDEVKKTCHKILNDFGKVDLLVLNAGIEFTEAINEVNIEHWHQMLEVNVSSAFYFLKFLVDSMVHHKKGNVIILSSVAKITGAGGGIHYATTKAALIGIMSRVNYELLSKGVRANMISPGMVDTPMLRKKYPDNDEVNKKLAEQVPMGRIADPSDVANLALFLASDMSAYICGQDILIDGGRLLYRRPNVTAQTLKSS